MCENIIEDLKIALSECELLNEVCICDSNEYNDKCYLEVLSCKLLLDLGIEIPIVICIPSNWEQVLIDIYVIKYACLDFIPHIEPKGKICLFTKEGLLIDKNLIGITIQSLYRAQNIIDEGLIKSNKMDFIDEFESYWIQLNNCRIAHLAVPSNHATQQLKYSIPKLVKRKKESQIYYNRRMRTSTIYMAENMNELVKWKLSMGTISNALYLVIKPDTFIFPPDYRKDIDNDYLNFLLRYVQCKEAIQHLKSLGRKKILIFEIIQPNMKTSYIGFYFEDGLLRFDSSTMIFSETKNMLPIAVHRIDKQYLMTRTSENKVDNFKKILVIGCGSIGGYLINELAKQGYENLTIVDDDSLSYENIFRHLLGMEYVFEKKSTAIKTYIDKNIPEMDIKSITVKIEDCIEYDLLDLNDFDLVISATGNHNVNRWLNSFVFESKICTPVIYAWNEVYGIGNHVAFFKYGNKGCFDCLFDRNEITGELYDKTSYCKQGQTVVKSVYGCDKSFLPYGNTISLKTIIICMDVINEVLKGKTSENFIVSQKGDDSFLKENGLDVSNKFIYQQEQIKKILGNNFENPRCGVCQNDC